jgi:hypothetical protein
MDSSRRTGVRGTANDTGTETENGGKVGIEGPKEEVESSGKSGGKKGVEGPKEEERSGAEDPKATEGTGADKGLDYCQSVSIETHGRGSRRIPPRGRQGSTTVDALIGLTASYRFSPRWAVRVIWDRAATDYNQDTDILLAGLTYRF